MILDQSGNPYPTVSTDTFSPLYEGASTSARMGDWGLSGAGPNVGLSGNSAIRRRGRHLERNNAVVKSALESFVSNMVGVGVTPEFCFANPEQAEEVKEVWEDSVSEMDYLGFSSFYGLQEQVARLLVRDGEAIVVIRDVPPSPDLLVPLQLQVLEADHLDISYNDIAASGNEIRHSIEFENGKPVALWLFENHPGETYLTATSYERKRVPMEDACLVFRSTRGGQVRGGSFLAPLITKLNLIDKYDDAELAKKLKTSLIGGFVYQDMAHVAPPMPGQQVGKAKNGVSSIELKPGTFPVLRDGMKIAFSDTADVGNNYEPFMKVQYQTVASGLTGITYEQLTGNLSGVNYTSLRAGRIESDRFCAMVVDRTVVFQFCRKFINRWMRTAILTGAITSISVKDYLAKPRKFQRISWHPHVKPFTDPVKDRLAEQMDARNGLTSRREIAARHNRSVENIDRENSEDLQRAESYGLRYDCYPSHSNKAGTAQKIEETVIQDSVKVE